MLASINMARPPTASRRSKAFQHGGGSPNTMVNSETIKVLVPEEKSKKKRTAFVEQSHTKGQGDAETGPLT